MLNKPMHDLIIASLDLKETSIKRAMKSANPRMNIVYEQDLQDLADARKWVRDQKLDTPK